MDGYSILRSYGWAFLLPLLVVLISVVLVFSPVFNLDPEGLSIGITLDLMVTAPLLYFLLIRKKPISKLTVVPWLIGGILLANVLLPAGNQNLAQMAMTYVIPLIELGVFSLVIFRVYQLVKTYKAAGSKSKDFLTGVHESTQKVFGKGLAANLLAWELAIFYYCFVKWRKPAYPENHFTYHKQAPIKTMLVVLMFLIVVETVVFHLLIQIWSTTAAWIFTILSVYTLFWILAQWKAMAFRPVIIEESHMHLRNGMAFQTKIPLNSLSQVVIVKNANKKEGKVLSLLPEMDSPNLKLTLTAPIAVTGLYGTVTDEDIIFLKVDDPEACMAYLGELVPDLF